MVAHRPVRALVVAATLWAAVPAAAAPAPLYNKSVSVSWTEQRVQRAVGTSAFRQVGSSVNWTVYVSSAGRLFTRQYRTSTARPNSSTTEHGPGDVPVPGLKASHANFQGTSMTAISQYPSGARQIVVNFDSGFTSCTARIGYGKEGGNNQVMLSQVSKRMVEVQSVQIVSPACSVKTGNAFAQ